MKAEPLKKEIYNKAKELGIENITLHFSGGSDEGYLDIELIPYEKHKQEFVNEIEDWAWEVYSYSGAGEGNDYGDDIEYHLKTGRVLTSEWFTSRQEGDSENDILEIAEEEESQEE
jgi:hypothetical protein